MLLVASQIVAALVIASVLATLVSAAMGYAALVGAVIGILPNYYFASRLMRPRTSAAAEQSLREVYVGEFVKIAFTVALFVIAIKILSVDFLVVVLTYAAMVIVNWLALLFSDLGESARVPSSVSGQVRIDSK